MEYDWFGVFHESLKINANLGISLADSIIFSQVLTYF